MNEIMASEEIDIKNMIYEIRDKQVMLDSDLAKLYKCANGTKTINQAVLRHKERFPDDFYFELSSEECKKMWSQVGTTKTNMSRSLPHVFTEQGVAMLATILRTDVAASVSISIMRAFVAMHKYLGDNYLEQKNMQNMLIKHDNDIKLLQESFKRFEEKKNVNEIYFNGQIYDAYSKIVDILNNSKDRIIIIDGYSDKTTLDIIRNVKTGVILITKSKSNIKKIDLKKYQKQYNNLKLIYDDTFHDRYIIIDNDIVYHLGTSINFAGSRTFSINILEDTLIKKALINKINNIIRTSK